MPAKSALDAGEVYRRAVWSMVEMPCFPPATARARPCVAAWAANESRQWSGSPRASGLRSHLSRAVVCYPALTLEPFRG